LDHKKALQALLPPASAIANFPRWSEHTLPHKNAQREKSQFQSRHETITFWWLFCLPTQEKSSPTATVIKKLFKKYF
jgi:hypothetical protein